MASQAAVRYTDTVKRVRFIRDTANDVRLRPLARGRARILLHASLAGYVAAWEAYLEQLVREFFQVTADPLNPHYNAIHTLLRDHSTGALDRFNTPNADNARNLLIAYTAFDPYPVWIWPARNFNGVQVRDRLGEILKVRHSFAHGFSMPAYSWNTTARGDVRLNWDIVAMTERFFGNLVTRTDVGMNVHVTITYGRPLF